MEKTIDLGLSDVKKNNEVYPIQARIVEAW
jgi:hypothetical protein